MESELSSYFHPLTRTAGSDKKYYGLYEGVVEDVDDPLYLGRVKVRINHLHPTREVVALRPDGSRAVEFQTKASVEDLPFAYPCFFAGSFVPPEVGERVWVMFRQGDKDHPVYIGTWYGVTNQNHTKGRLPTSPPPSRNPLYRNDPYGNGIPSVDKKALNKTTYLRKPGNNAPKDAWYRSATLDPKIRVVASTPKGHTFYMNDDDGNERLAIVDRFGQVFEMVCPVKPEYNAANASRRNTHEVTEGTPLPLERAVGNRTSIRIMDATHQFLEFTADGTGRRETVLKNPVCGFLSLEEDGPQITLQHITKATLAINDSGILMLSQDPGCRLFLGATGQAMLSSGSGSFINLDKDLTLRSSDGITGLSFSPNGTCSLVSKSGTTLSITKSGEVSIHGASGSVILTDAAGNIFMSAAGGATIVLAGPIVSINPAPI